MPAYASRDDLTRLGVQGAALADLPDEAIATALEAASRLADSFLSARYVLPLKTWGLDLRRAVAVLAAYDVLSARGFSPVGADEHIRLRAEDAMRWLENIARGVATPADVVDSTPQKGEEGTYVYTTKRRWP